MPSYGPPVVPSSYPVLLANIMKNIIPILVTLCCLASAGVAHAQQDSPELEAKIRELMAVTGSAGMTIQSIEQILGSMKQALPQVPEEFWQNFMERLDRDQLIDMIVPIYAEHFTEEEIDAMLGFYKSDVGQRVIAKLPVVMRESALAGQEWGKKTAMQVIDQLKAKGYDVDP